MIMVSQEQVFVRFSYKCYAFNPNLACSKK
jgi:hypothetical protein